MHFKPKGSSAVDEYLKRTDCKLRPLKRIFASLSLSLIPASPQEGWTQVRLRPHGLPVPLPRTTPSPSFLIIDYITQPTSQSAFHLGKTPLWTGLLWANLCDCNQISWRKSSSHPSPPTTSTAPPPPSPSELRLLGFHPTTPAVSWESLTNFQYWSSLWLAFVC